MKNSKAIVFLFSLIFMFSCISLQKISKKTDLNNFLEFSKKFYTDSQFQMSRINFPLNGTYNVNVPITKSNPMGDSVITGWNKKDWKMLTNTYFPNNETKVIIENTTYIRKSKIGSRSATINTYIENSGYSVVEKYAFRNGKWYLTYFSNLSY